MKDVHHPLSSPRLEFLAKLPVLLNSELGIREVIATAVEQIREQLSAEAATVFLLDPLGEYLTFWALGGDQTEDLEGKRMRADLGIVGWVIKNRSAVCVADAANDERFFRDIDREQQFQTKSLLCVPLISRGDKLIGALQVLNKKTDLFSPEDLLFVEKCSHQTALALDNALLFDDLRQRTQQLESLDRRKNDLITVINHEFKTPLNIIQNTVDMLAGGTLNSERTALMTEKLITSVQRLAKLISDVRNVGLVSQEYFPVAQEMITVHELLRDAVSQFTTALVQRKLECTVEVAEDVGEVKGDYLLLLVVLKNLLSNAIRFTPDGGTIALRAKYSAGLVEIVVADSGIGIHEKELSVIFEKFYEVTDVLNHTSGTFQFGSCGLGLGLATARGILSRHGSSLQVSSKPGVGSEFFFCLPGTKA